MHLWKITGLDINTCFVFVGIFAVYDYGPWRFLDRFLFFFLRRNRFWKNFDTRSELKVARNDTELGDTEQLVTLRCHLSKSILEQDSNQMSPVNFSDTDRVRTCSVDCLSKRLAEPVSTKGLFKCNVEIPVPLKEEVAFPSLAMNIFENPYIPSLVVK